MLETQNSYVFKTFKIPFPKKPGLIRGLNPGYLIPGLNRGFFSPFVTLVGGSRVSSWVGDQHDRRQIPVTDIFLEL